MNAQLMNWNDIHLVLAVCREGTLSGAARILGVNHSTVFRRINTIEENLGVKLFDRLPSGYVMTDAGEAILASASRIEEEVFDLSRKLIGKDARLEGHLRISAPDALVSSVLMSHFTAFNRRYPDVKLHLLIANDFTDLSRREADVAIRATRYPPETVIGRRLCQLATTVYGAETYLENHEGLAIDEHRWLLPEASLSAFPSFDWVRHQYPKVRVVLSSNTLPALYDACAQGLGIAPLPCFLADPDQNLRRLMLPPKEMETELWLLTHPDLRRTARVRAFMDFLSDAIKRDVALIEGEFETGQR